MIAKMKSCFTPHAMMHGLFGHGLGITAVALFPELNMLYPGLGVMLIAFLLDIMRTK